MTEATHRVLLDLGDVLTKGFIVGANRIRRFRFPSVVAHRLLPLRGEPGSLLLDEAQEIPRLADFNTSQFPRLRSFPGATRFLESVVEGHPIKRACFVGSLAAIYGADRSVLGRDPSAQNVEALIRRALTYLPKDCERAEVGMVVGLGAKAEVMITLAETQEHHATIKSWSYLRLAHHTRHLTYRMRIFDAPDCALAVLPSTMDPQQVGAVLLVDVGYLRTKLAIVSPLGCEQQQDLHGLGIVDCVRRILRDGQELGLIEDEVAVIQAFEQGRKSLRVADRTFEVGAAYESARLALEQELAGAIRRMLMDRFNRQATTCRGLALIGGGAGVVGEGLVDRLRETFRFDAVWIGEGMGFLLVEGARRRW